MQANATRQRYSRQGRRVYAKPGGPAVDRPFPVTLIAWFQFAKAWFLLLVAFVSKYVPDAVRAVPTLPAFVYVAAHGRNTNGYLLPAIGIYMGIVGWGLWRLKRWARRSLVASTGLMMAIWAYRFAADWAAGETTLKTPLEQQTVTVLLFLDAVIFFYLVIHDDVPLAFARSE